MSHSLFQDLSRRKVFRVAAMYIVGSWVLLQVADLAFPGLGIPDTAIRYVWVAVISGFPVALVFGWRYNLVDGRITRTPTAGHQGASDSLRRSDYLILSVLSAVAVAITWGLVTELALNRVIDVAPKPVVKIDPRSIAILPFSDQSAGHENASFLAFGIHDDLLTLLSRMGGIKIISRTSVEHYKGNQKTLRQIGSELRVAKIMEGSVQRAGDRVRINVQLVDVESDHHLWAEQFDREITAPNIFQIQSDIAEAIALVLKAQLSPKEIREIQTVPTQNLAALEAYFHAKQLMPRRTVDALESAISQLTRAIELDPDFATAYAALADALMTYGSYAGEAPEVTESKAKKVVTRAIAINENLGEAQAILAWLQWRNGKSEEAAAAFRKALILSPNSARILHLFGNFTISRGDTEGGIKLLEKALELDPRSQNIILNLADHNATTRYRFDDAMYYYKKCIEIDPLFPRGYLGVAYVYYWAYGQMDKALPWYLKGWSLDQKAPEAPGDIAGLFLDLGDAEMANQWLGVSDSVVPDHFEANVARERLELYRGNNRAAANYAKKSLNTRPGWWWSLMILRDYEMSQGKYSETLSRYQQTFPEIFLEPTPNIHNRNFESAIDVALVYQRAGNVPSAERLIEATLAYLSKQPRPRFGPHEIAEVRLYALQNKKAAALASLHIAVENGWRFDWRYYFDHDPNLDSIRGDPEFKALRRKVESDVAAQLVRARKIIAEDSWEALVAEELVTENST